MISGEIIFCCCKQNVFRLPFTFRCIWLSPAKTEGSQVARKVTCYWCRAWQCQVLGIGGRVHGYPSCGRDERTEGQDSTEEPVAAYLSPASGQMCSFLSLLAAPSLGMKRLKVCEAEFRETSNTDRGDKMEEKTTLWVIHLLSLLITPSIFLMQCNLSPCNSSFLLFELSPVSATCSCSIIWSHLPPQPVEQLQLPLEKLTPLLAALKAAKLILQASASA